MELCGKQTSHSDFYEITIDEQPTDVFRALATLAAHTDAGDGAS